MDLTVGSSADVAIEWTDDYGQAVDTPDDAQGSFTSSDPNLVAVQDNGDGSARLTAASTSGTAMLTATFTSGGVQFTGELPVSVVDNLATRINIVVVENDNELPQ